MTTIRYIKEPCPACVYVEDEYLSTIKDRYDLVKYDLRNESDRNNEYVQMWSRVTNKIPTAIVEGNGRVNFFVGVGGMEKLYNKCEGWRERNMRSRKVTEPVPSPREKIEPKIGLNTDEIKINKLKIGRSGIKL